MRSSDPLPSGAAGLVLLLGCDPDRKGDLSWPALAALAAADVVLHDRAVDPDTLALVPRRCLVEPVAEADGTARARRLAADGWRVVRLVIGDPGGTEAERLGAAGRAHRHPRQPEVWCRGRGRRGAATAGDRAQRPGRLNPRQLGRCC